VSTKEGRTGGLAPLTWIIARERGTRPNQPKGPHLRLASLDSIMWFLGPIQTHSSCKMRGTGPRFVKWRPMPENSRERCEGEAHSPESDAAGLPIPEAA
jgi:hypothetical protein